MDTQKPIQLKHPQKRKRKVVLALGLLAGCGSTPPKPSRDPKPIVETLSQSFGAPGTPVRVAGLNLNARSLRAYFSGVPTVPVERHAAEAVFLVPPAAQSGIMYLKTSGGKSDSVYFEIAQPDAEPWTAVAAGSFHTCGIKASGAMLCWGDNETGQLGFPVTQPAAHPRLIASARRWHSIAPGTYMELGNTCAVDTGGALWCWGDNTSGQYGNGSLTSKAVPAHSGGALLWSTVSLGSYHACGISGGELYCWGTEKFYVMGTGEKTLTPRHVAPPAGQTGWAEVSAGTLHTCAITLPGRRLYCWGSNRGGQLGTGDLEDAAAPVAVATTEAWRSVNAGSYVSEGNTCAISTGGELYCWGDNNYGQVGDGTRGDRNTPVKLAGRWQSVTLGGVHACAIDDAGKLWCWGNNAAGQTGAADLNATLTTPLQVGEAADWSQLTAGATHTCALNTSGALFCWGDNDSGQLGRHTRDVSNPQPGAVTFAFR